MKRIVEMSEGDIIICGHGKSFSVLFNDLTDATFGYDEFLEIKMPNVFEYVIGSKKIVKYL
ncbi:hypothetical protein [Macrococcus animalis]|uniref:hypothetical protein n=1 Tax=Macrococcus animalis TaxID=3395467 RepID=UPI0039BE930D